VATPSIFRGADAMMANLTKLQAFSPDEFARAIYQEAQIEATECKRRTPVDTGALRASIVVEDPKREGRKISVAIVAGGPSVDYALKVHEDLEAFHSNGEAKFIERPLRESAPHMASRIAARIDLNKAL
jgi:hypothetical protein